MKKLFTFANQLTFLRLGLIPFFVLAVLGRHFGWALGLLLAAAVSDFFDGLLARWLKQRSALGATLDPIADKLLLSTSFVVLAISGAIPWWITILVLSRDVLIFGVAMAMTIGARRSTGSCARACRWSPCLPPCWWKWSPTNGWPGSSWPCWG
jgi:cardiolipin synthase